MNRCTSTLSGNSYPPPPIQGHMMKHTGERPYSCKQCTKCYTTSSALRIHEKNAHNERVTTTPHTPHTTPHTPHHTTLPPTPHYLTPHT